MIRSALPIALLAALAFTACKRDQPADTRDAGTDTPAASTPATAPATTTPAPTAAPAASATPAQVVAVELGTAVDASNKVTAAATTFRPTDTVYVSVATSTADPAASIPAKLGARWTKDGQTVHEQNLDVTLAGSGQTAFKIAKPSGFPAGRYRVEILLNGQPVQSREFEVAAGG
ncbi:MAG TPA: hypothetical protein VEY50_02025 [Lysobacter sp.]|nr:hypothetical protein [Lysobacter sp.]